MNDLEQFFAVPAEKPSESMNERWAELRATEMVNYPKFLSGANKTTAASRNLLHLNGYRSANYG